MRHTDITLSAVGAVKNAVATGSIPVYIGHVTQAQTPPYHVITETFFTPTSAKDGTERRTTMQLHTWAADFDVCAGKRAEALELAQSAAGTWLVKHTGGTIVRDPDLTRSLYHGTLLLEVAA